MIQVDVLITDKNWKKHISNPNTYLNNKLKKATKKINLFKKNKIYFTILLSGNIEIKKLNKKFRKKNKVTDVLSFPFHEKKILNKLLRKNNNSIYLGDIIINLNKIINMSKQNIFSTTFDKIWVHGLVHLFGYRHKLNKDFYIMKKLENKVTSSIK